MSEDLIKVRCTKCHGRGYLEGNQYEGRRGEPKRCYACNGIGKQDEIIGAQDAVPGSSITLVKDCWHCRFYAVSERIVTISEYVDSPDFGVSPSKVTWQPVGMARWIYQQHIRNGFVVKSREAGN